MIYISISALVISFISIIISYFNLKNSKDKLLFELFKNIDDSWKFYIQIQKENNPDIDNAAFERVLTSYEFACGFYLDGKLDKTRFKKDFENDLRTLIESEATKYDFNLVATPYQSLVSVYKQWCNKIK